MPTTQSLSPQGRTSILYGNSGVGKTTALYHFIKRLVAETGKPARCVSWEDSSKTTFGPLIESGALDYLNVAAAADPLALVDLLREGNWPVGKEWVPVEKWAGTISGYVFEGLTTGSESELEACRKGHRFLREQAKDAFESGGAKFAAASQTAYGFVQMEMLAALKRCSGLPVEHVIWTAHEVSATSEDNQAIRGPALVGSAKTARVQAYAGTVLHLDEIGGEVRCYFRPHPDPRLPGLTYPAKITLPPDRAAAFLAPFEGRNYFPVRLDQPDVADFLFRLRDFSRGQMPEGQ